MKHIILGNRGEHIDVAISLDFEPILVTCRIPPELLTSFSLNMLILQTIVDMICNTLEMPARKVFFSKRHETPIFNFKKDVYVREFLHNGHFGGYYYLHTHVSKVKNILGNVWDNKHLEMLQREHREECFCVLKRQKVALQKDCIEISNTTLNNVLNSLVSQSKSPFV